MISSLFYLVLAILGLGFLIFIHELGHYIVARRVGMKVESFSIGFGPAFFSWMRDGVKWQFCILPFGGFVKIAGMQKEDGADPYQIPDGFFGKKPLDRIKVAITGPAVNIIFAFLALTAIWMSGGRNKSFSEFTRKIGWVKMDSPLYDYGVRPGDEVTKYGGKDYQGPKDLILGSLLKENKTEIAGFKEDYYRQKKTPFSYLLPNKEDPDNPFKMHSIGFGAPASYLMVPNEGLETWSPLRGTGIESGDRLFWANGEIIFSLAHLKSLLSPAHSFLTIERNGEIIHSKVPRVKIGDLKLSSQERAELEDWQHEVHLAGKIQDLYFLPYTFAYDNTVTKRLNFLDENEQKKAFLTCDRCVFFHPLRIGDKVIAVDGVPTAQSYELLHKLQKKHTLLIVERDPKLAQIIPYKDEDENFDKLINTPDLLKIIKTLGTSNQLTASGNLQLLQPIVPLTFSEIPTSDQQFNLQRQIDFRKKEISKIKDKKKKQEYLLSIQKELEKEILLGVHLQDRKVKYNPNPITEFGAVVKDIWQTLSSLISGVISPKWLMGPVGIVHSVQQSWFFGVREALFWMAVVSLNLGILNLLPIPILDGGHIVFSFFEMFTKKKIKIKTMERLILPFVILLVGFFIYATYHDISRLFH